MVELWRALASFQKCLFCIVDWPDFHCLTAWQFVDDMLLRLFIFWKHAGLHVSDCIACSLAESRTGNRISESQLIQYFARRETERNRKWQGWNSVWKHEFLYSNPPFLQHSIGPLSHFLRLSVDAEEGGGDALHTDSTPWWWKPLSTCSSGVTSSILPLSLEPHP